jgi:hypothetical protein
MADTTTIKDFFGDNLKFEFQVEDDFTEIMVHDGIIAVVVKGHDLTTDTMGRLKKFINKVSFVKGPSVCQKPNAWNAIEDNMKLFFDVYDVTFE